jgi:hypothetical protein
MVTGLKGTNYEERCKELGLQILAEGRALQDLVLAHRLIGDDIEGGGEMLTGWNSQKGSG